MRIQRLIARLLLPFLAIGFMAGCTVRFPDELADDSDIKRSLSSAGTTESASGSTEMTSADGTTPSLKETRDTAVSQTSAVTNKTSGKTTVPPLAAQTTKDKYRTDPVPSGNPVPVEPEDAHVDEKKTLTCTLSISCKTILDNWDLLKANKKGQVPADGVIYKERTVVFYEGETVFNLLNRETKKKRIHMEFSFFPLYNSNYIEGIHNLYEFDCGEGSGWMYKVNGWFPNYGCSRYPLKQNDKVEWLYTCDLGHDLGTSFDGARPQGE